MRFEDGRGVEAFEGRPRRMGFTAAEIERSRDLAMLAMHRDKTPLAVIARYFNVSIATVKRRIKAIPPEARMRYAARRTLD